jgi:membrane protein implicated in regulation of membrane protease activity
MFAIVALVLLLALPWPWDLVGFVIGLVLFCGELFFWNRRVRGRRKVVGAQTLIGEAATVVLACRPQGQVRLSGEIWAARCEGGADVGEAVTVVGRDGLTLLVERARASAAPSETGC